MDWFNMKHSFVDLLNPRCGALMANAIAQILADDLNYRQMYALAGFISTIGTTLSYIAAQTLLNETINLPPSGSLDL